MITFCVRNALFRSLRSKNVSGTRHFAKDINPAEKTWKILTGDVPVSLGLKKPEIVYPEHADVVIIGGGFLGAATAYWLKSRAVHGLEVVVLEKDTTYKSIQTNYSLGTLTQHFSEIENIKLSQHCAEFLRNTGEHLSKDVDLQYNPTGSLVLASEQYADRLEQNVAIMKEEGQRLELIMPSDIKNQFPWLNTDDVKLGCMGLESEGTFNPSALLKGFLLKSAELGAKYVEAEVVGFELQMQKDVLMEGVSPGTYKRLNRVKYMTADGEERSIKFAACVLAAGDQSGAIGQFMDIGTGEGMLSVGFPTAKREINVYSVNSSGVKMSLRTPMVSDTSGLWVRRDGLQDNFIFGVQPLSSEGENYNDDEYYKNIVLVSLSNRILGCNTSEVKCLNTEIYDTNQFDDSGILGVHPYYNNLFLATGFGKLGCQHSPAIGRAIAELIIDSRFTTIDFTRFSFDRFLIQEPVVEFNVY